jgi:hypothetical protein
MSTIAFFNLADVSTAPSGLAAKSVKALRVKRGNANVQQADLFDLLEPPDPTLENGPALRQEKLLQVKLLCASVDKVMLSIHGDFDDTTHGYYMDAHRARKQVSCQRRSELVLELLETNHSYVLALIMCFGGRGEDYRENHSTFTTETATTVTTSFASKLFKRICKQRRVVMTARTGSVGFNEDTGHSDGLGPSCRSRARGGP